MIINTFYVDNHLSLSKVNDVTHIVDYLKRVDGLTGKSTLDSFKEKINSVLDEAIMNASIMQDIRGDIYVMKIDLELYFDTK